MKSLYFLAIGLMFCSCSHSTPNGSEKKEANVSAVVEHNNQFAFDLYQHVKSNHTNICFSPYSIFNAFSMTAIGAKGSTAVQMWNTLHSEPKEIPAIRQLKDALVLDIRLERDPEVNLANALWVQEELPILPGFVKDVEKNFGAAVEYTDYVNHPENAVEKINAWVSKNTQSKIREIVSQADISPATRLILANAFHIKAQWREPFEKELTTQELFYTSPQDSIEVPMMHTTASFRLMENHGLTLIELPYEYNFEDAPALSMVIVVPAEGMRLNDLEDSLSLAQWQEWMQSAKWRSVSLSLPKFSIESELELNPIMTSLGMERAFTPKANFSGITGYKDLYINEAIHKTFIKVDEEGTEAAGATRVSMALTSLLEPEEPYRLNVNRPFLYFIVGKSNSVFRTPTPNAILFMGRVVQP